MTTIDGSGADDSLKRRVSKRLQAEGKWPEASIVRDQLMREAREAGLSKDNAQDQTYRQLDQLFPPAGTEQQAGQDRAEGGEGDATIGADASPANEDSGTRARQDDGVSGLDVIPADWPSLPANASLAQEIGWVQANRLSVTRTVDRVTVVDLARSLSPAPSWSALGWLETSIRAYSKFVDVAAKVSAGAEDDREATRREKLAIDEIRSLLAEMRG